MPDPGTFGLYVLDVYVAQLTLNKEVYIDTSGSTLVAKVVFLNFPATEVVERGRFVKDEKIYVYEFTSGQTFHFSMPCEKLVQKMKKVPVKIGVFGKDDNFPICHLHTYLSGCACDLGSVYVEKAIPFSFKGPFDLVDPGKTFAGQLDLEITIKNLGRNVIIPFVLAPNCFVFKNDPEGPEFKCNIKDAPNPNINVMLDKLLDIMPPGNLMKDVAGISPVADHLALGSPPPKLPRPPLIDPLASKKKGRKGKKGKKK